MVEQIICELPLEINKVRTMELYHIDEAYKILRQTGAISCDFNVLLRTVRFSYWSYGGKAFSGRYPSCIFRNCSPRACDALCAWIWKRLRAGGGLTKEAGHSLVVMSPEER